jgi:FkbM family methyltransferase
MKKNKEYQKMLGSVSMTVHNPVMVSVGANDGVHADRVIPFCIRNGWKSILIEPIPHIMQKCKKNWESHSKINRNIYFVQAAASDRSETIEMKFIDPNATISRKHKKDDMGKASASESYEFADYLSEHIRTISVPSMKLDDIISARVDKVNVLSVDVEGFEPKVFAGFNVSKWRPLVIIWETKHLSSSVKRPIMRKLSKLGYKHREYGPDCISALMGLERLVDVT